MYYNIDLDLKHVLPCNMLVSIRITSRTERENIFLFVWVGGNRHRNCPVTCCRVYFLSYFMCTQIYLSETRAH